MTAKVLDGRALAREMEEEVRAEAARLREKGVQPLLADILIGRDDASLVYIEKKRRACRRVGMGFKFIHLRDETTEEELVSLIEELNSGHRANGILLQLPLPSRMNEARVLASIAPEKDVDGLSPRNMGRLMEGDETLAPCTPKGIVIMLSRSGVRLEGAEVVIVNNTSLIGKPLAMMLTNRFATVTICHVKTSDLGEHTRRAEILVTATGCPNLITAKMVREGAAVVDAGTCREGGVVRGDVDFEGVREKASLITPVPGGVGPVTVAVVLKNLLTATKLQRGFV